MRIVLTIVALLALAPGIALAQGFSDVSPCHWAFDAVQRGAAAGIWTGYPGTASAREQAENAVVQVYEGLRCRNAEWIGHFTTNRPATWEQTVARAQVASLVITDMVVRLGADVGTATYTVRWVAGGQTRTQNVQTTVRLVEGRWLADYATLPAALFR